MKARPGRVRPAQVVPIRHPDGVIRLSSRRLLPVGDAERRSRGVPLAPAKCPAVRPQQLALRREFQCRLVALRISREGGASLPLTPLPPARRKTSCRSLPERDGFLHRPVRIDHAHTARSTMLAACGRRRYCLIQGSRPSDLCWRREFAPVHGNPVEIWRGPRSRRRQQNLSVRSVCQFSLKGEVWGSEIRGGLGSLESRQDDVKPVGATRRESTPCCCHLRTSSKKNSVPHLRWWKDLNVINSHNETLRKFVQRLIQHRCQLQVLGESSGEDRVDQPRLEGEAQIRASISATVRVKLA